MRAVGYPTSLSSRTPPTPACFTSAQHCPPPTAPQSETAPLKPPSLESPLWKAPLRRGGAAPRGGGVGTDSVLYSGRRTDPPLPPLHRGVFRRGRPPPDSPLWTAPLRRGAAAPRGGGVGTDSVLYSGRRTDPPCPPCIGGVFGAPYSRPITNDTDVVPEPPMFSVATRFASGTW